MKNKLQEMREKKGISREQLAKYLNMSVPNLYMIETNSRELNKKYFEKITQLFNCSISQIFGEELITQGETNLIKIKYYKNFNSNISDFNNEDNYNYELIPERLFKILKIVDYKNLIMFNMPEKNMEPIISLEDFVIVDLNRIKPLNNRIYLIKEEQELKLKKILRTSPVDPNIKILSENQIDGDFPPYDLTMEQAKEFIIGQVVFYGRSIL